MTRRGLRGADSGRGRRARRRLAEGARPAREARELPPLGRHLRALPHADRAARLAAVVVPDGRARRVRRSTRFEARRVRFHPESQHRFAIDVARERRPTGASRGSSGGGTSSRSGRARRPRDRAPGRRPSAAPSAARAELEREPGRPRHVVLVGALAVRDARLAGRRRPSSTATTRATSTSPRARSFGSGRTG